MILFEGRVPKENLDSFAVVRTCHFNSGDKVNKNDIVMELETSKTITEIITDCDGYIEYAFSENDEANIGDVCFRIHDKLEFRSSHNPNAKDSNNFKLSKAAQEYCQKNNINVNQLELSGRISLEKLLNYLNVDNFQNIEGDSQVATNSNITESVSHDNLLKQEIESFKRREIDYISSVNSTGLTSSITTTVNIPYSARHKQFLKDIIFEASRLLKKYKLLNSYIDGNNLFIRNNVSIGVAIDGGEGLKVVSIHDADSKKFSVISHELDGLIIKYLENNLESNDLTGSGFTITDLSDFNVFDFKPLVNFKQSSILGISSFNSSLKGFNVTLTFDHRVTEGRYVAEFLDDLKNRLESIVKEESKEIVSCSACNKSLNDDKELNGRGFIKLINHDLEDILLCQICFSGWGG